MKSLSSRAWVLTALVLLALAIFFWWKVRDPSQTTLPGVSSDIVITNGEVFFPHLGKPKYPLLTRLPGRAGQSTNASSATASIQKEAIDYLPPEPKFPYRLRNTLRPLEELASLDTAILLNNALIDTESPMPLAVPEHLRASAETESYLLQSAGQFDQVFDRETLSQLGVEKVAYIPHNTWIVRMKPATAEELKRFAGTQSVLPFEPYFKLSRPLLGWAAQRGDIPGVLTLRLTLFHGAEEEVFAALKTMGMQYLSEGRSPFGRTVALKAPRSTLGAIASLDGVLTVESIAPRRMANDLTRVLLGADSSATNQMMNTNIHNLSGEDILVNLNDTGVDEDHPGFSRERLISGDSADRDDPSGHGTHIAGTIAGNGAESPVITNALGSLTNANFHGMAPKASLYVLRVDLAAGPLISDEFLQEAAAEYNYVHYVNQQGETNTPLLSNNSWNYRNIREYDSSAASYDAAVRDALPEKEGDQPILYVFSAGKVQVRNQQGQGGESDSISSPATAKNVITVGAIETLRYITNSVKTGTIDQITTNEDGTTMTNQVDDEEQVFLPATDSSTEVASFSGRGNVGIGIEGAGGRFKPDVVAPGSFIISARSKGWQSSEQFLDKQVNTISNQSAISNDLSSYPIFLREGTIEVEISLQTNVASPEVLPPLPIYAQFDSPATTNNLVGYTSVRLADEESSPLRIDPESFPRLLYYSIGNTNDNPVSFDIQEVISVETGNEEYLDELQKLNESLKPHYRFESGTSTAAPAVTGLLALIQEFLRNNGLDNPSPALLKALLINGVRTSGELYNFQVDPIINFQGWGLVNLDNSLPANLTNNLPFNPSSPQDFAGGESTIRFLDQHPTNALATGEQKSWKLTLDETNQIRALPLRLSLVWTDPPGNPSAGIKLVNDLDLIVSNTVSGEILCGNNFTADSLFTQTTSANESLRLDNVNNVENVFISPPLDTNYVVSVVARRVNVNAVTDHPNDVVQDFALVVSVGDNVEVEEPFQLEELEEDAEEELKDVKYVETPSLIVITNGIPRLADRVGANAPLLGETNGLSHQWQFYVFTNSSSPLGTNDLGNGLGFTNGPNVAFVTFLPPNLARPRNFEADVDLYVSMNPGLTNLNARVIGDAIQGNNDTGTGVSRGPGGTEAVILTNQNTGNDQVYYIGVKSEDHQGGEYAIVGVSQNEPFEELQNGQRVLNGVPLNQGIIPDGSPNAPGAGLVLALGYTPLTIQRVTAELSLVHDDIGDLLGNLSHNDVSVVLNNHTLLDTDGTFTNLNVTYDDLGNVENPGQVGLIQRSDGPGSLVHFIGGQGHGVWLMAQVDNALTQTGRVYGLTLRLTPSRLLEGTNIIETVQSTNFSYFVIDVPTDASALEVYLSDFDRPLDLYLRRGSLPTLTQFDKRALGTDSAVSNGLRLSITRRDVPPLSPGQYFIGVYNPNQVAVQFQLQYIIKRDLPIAAEQPFFPDKDELDKAVTDDAVTYSPIFVPDNRVIADVKVGLRIDHPRTSDLTMHLVSPIGTRVLLSENRGGDDADGWGAGQTETLTFGGFSDPDPAEHEEEELEPEKMIKFALSPYTAASTNINSFSFSSFEEAEPEAYTAEERFPANASVFWEVLSGTAIISSNDEAAEGTNYLHLDSGRVSASNLLVVLPDAMMNRTLDLFYSARSSVDRGAPIGAIFLNSNRVQSVDGGIEWRRNTPIRFLVPPKAKSIPIELVSLPGQPPMQIDHIEIREPAPVKFFYPEETLSQFDGEPALGNWTLELWDNRDGPEDAQPVLKTWQLLLSLSERNFPASSINNGECVTDTVQGDEIKYYIVDVPRSTTFATNWLNSEGNLLLLLNEDGVPQGTGDDNLSTDFNGKGEGGAVLSLNGTVLYDAETNQIESFDMPMLHPGQRYYLGVKNADSDEENEYELCIQFDQIDLQYPIITLTNAVPFTNTISFTEPAEFQYYRYRVGTNVIELNIEVFPENGDVDAVAKLGLPLPNLVEFDKQSTNGGLDSELITFSNEDSATTIPSGSYYISVYNANTNRTEVHYRIVATETIVPPYIIHPLTNSVPFLSKVGDNTVGKNARVKNYFRLRFANPKVSSVQFDLSDFTGTADLILKKDNLPSMDDYDRVAVADPDRPGSGRIVIRTNATLPDLSGDWFAAVLNRRVEDLDFTITGTTFTGDPSAVDSIRITTLSNRVWFTNTVVASIPNELRERDYYRFVVADEAANVTFSLHPLVGDGVGKDLDLYLRRGLLPSESDFDAISARVNSSAEVIHLGGGTNANLPLEPGEWLLAVVNYEREAVTYRIQAFQNLALGLAGDFLSGCFDLDSTPGLRYRVEVKILPEDPWDGLEEIVANSEQTRWCPPSSLKNFSDLRAVEAEDPPDLVLGTVKEREEDLEVEIELSEREVCLSWDAELGETYTIEEKAMLSEEEWTLIEVVLAESEREEYCMEMPTVDYHFFRIRRGGEPLPQPPSEIVRFAQLEGVRFNAEQKLCITWISESGVSYLLQGTENLDDPEWNDIETILADGELASYCFPIDMLSMRFFRVAILGTTPITQPRVTLQARLLEDGGVNLTWKAGAGRQFRVEFTDMIPPRNWTIIPMIVSSDSGDFSFMDDGSISGELSEQRYYRLREVE